MVCACDAVCPRRQAAAPPQLEILVSSGRRKSATTVDIEAHGKFDHWPVQAWVDRPGVTLAPKEEKGKFAATVAADAMPGVYWLRFYDAEGATPPCPLLLAHLPEVNRTRAQQLAGQAARACWRRRSSSTAGCSARETSTRSRSGWKKARLSWPKSRRIACLASPVDAVLEVVSTDGFVLARNDDDQELDPRIVFTAPKSGVYLVRIFGFPAAPNSTIALAGEEAVCVSIDALPSTGFWIILCRWPSRPKTQQVEAHGWNLPAEARQLSRGSCPTRSRRCSFIRSWQTRSSADRTPSVDRGR